VETVENLFRRLEQLNEIGAALSQEKNLDALLENILIAAKTITRADGGTLYLRTEDRRLKFAIMRTDSLNIAMGGTTDLHLLLFLNDGIADGRDISWIWDADYELVAEQTASVVASGTRAEELALRLKYADFRAQPAIVHDAQAALDAALAQTPAGETLYVVPTYTAMLEVRELLAHRGGKQRFWEEHDG